MARPTTLLVTCLAIALAVVVGCGGGTDSDKVVAALTSVPGTPAGLVRELPAGRVRELPAEPSETKLMRVLAERASTIHPEFSASANAVLPLDAEVRCWSDGGWDELLAIGDDDDDHELLGFTDLFTLQIHLAPDVCAVLGAFVDGDLPEPSQSIELAEAVGVLAHEAHHLLAGSNEAVTDCTALQRVGRVASALGSDPVLAAATASLTWTDVHAYLQDVYRTELCRQDGPLDLTPGDGRWP